MPRGKTLIPRTGVAGVICGVALAAVLVGFMFAALSRPYGVLTVVGLVGLVCTGTVMGWMMRVDWENR